MPRQQTSQRIIYNDVIVKELTEKKITKLPSIPKSADNFEEEIEMHNSTIESIDSNPSGVISDPENSEQLNPNIHGNLTTTPSLTQAMTSRSSSDPSPIIKTRTTIPTTYARINLNAPGNQEDLPPTTR